jgi:hypothetical protein
VRLPSGSSEVGRSGRIPIFRCDGEVHCLGKGSHAAILEKARIAAAFATIRITPDTVFERVKGESLTDVQRIINDLERQRAAIDRAIAALREITGSAAPPDRVSRNREESGTQYQS